MRRMPKLILAMGVAGAILLTTALIMHARELEPPERPAVANAGPVSVPIPPPPAAAPAETAPAAPDATAAATAPAAPPPSDALPALPEKEIKPRGQFMVTDDQPLPIPHVTIQDRQGRILSRPAPAQTAMVPPAPRSPTSFSSLAPTAGAQRVPQPAEPQGPLQPIPATLSGPAHATGTISLGVDGHAVRLFGVLPPASTDRCTLGRGGLMPCAEVTQEVLASRVARSPSITCRVPPGLSESGPSRICLDANGGDIAGYLVAEGLALADRKTSGDYIGAEGIAQSYGKGLWHYR